MQSSMNEVLASEMKYVGVGLRFLAHLIDSIFLIAAVASFDVIFFMGVDSVLRVVENTNIFFLLSPVISIVELVIFLLFVVFFLTYPIIMEATQGATIGKKMLGLCVVTKDGMPISWKASIIRNLLRIVDLLFYGLVGAVLIWTSPTRQRLGDHVAKTVVIRRCSISTASEKSIGNFCSIALIENTTPTSSHN
jgi:uncharacterized RDD family membrane protein YckC